MQRCSAPATAWKAISRHLPIQIFTAILAIAVVAAGKYAVWARGYLGGGDRSFSLALAGKALPPTHLGTAPAGFLWELAGIADLAAGQVPLEVRDAGTGHEVADAVLITSDLRFDPGLAESLYDPPVDGAALNAKLLDLVVSESVRAAKAAHERNATAMASRETWSERRKGLLPKLRTALGLEPLPDRTPLNVKVLGTTDRDGYSIQRVLYESRPGFPVTANVYAPKDKGLADARGRLPAVLCPIGHWGLSKAEPVVQARCAFLARRGFLVLVYDPFGQGEREVAGNDHAESFRGVPAGLINMSFMVWDTVRGLDYLLERGDADPERIGCTGASGGGLNTLYVSAIDGRIRALVPAVYLTGFAEFLLTGIAHCPCSHVPGLLEFADMGDVLALIAPRPTLLLTARADDMFTVAGARTALEEALPAWRAEGAPDSLKLGEFDGPHGYGQPMREAMVGFLEKHLLGRGDGSPIPEPAFTPEPPGSPALRCFPEGKVPPTAQTVASLALAEARRLAAALSPAPGESQRDLLAELLGWESQPPRIEALEALQALPSSDPSLPSAFILRTEGVSVPFLRYRSSGARAVAVFLGSQGAAKARESRLFQALRESPLDVIVPDLPGWGSTAGREHLLHTNSLLLGKPMIARRARALAALLRSVRAFQGALKAAQAAADLDTPAGPEPGGKTPVRSARIILVADGAAAGLTALVAKALLPEPGPVAILGLPPTLVSLMEEGISPETAVFGILKVADVPQLCTLCGGPVKIAEEAGLPDLMRWILERLGP